MPHAAETNLQLITRFFTDVLNGANPAAAGELLAPDFVAHHSSLPGGRGGAVEIAALLGSFMTAFPDLRYTMDAHINEGNRIATRWTATGTHRGAFLNIPPTNRSVSIMGFDEFRIADGRLAEVWVCSDLLHLLQQLGAFPPQ
jgi:steroid delta-isomerase-like uncharacterized protein